MSLHPFTASVIDAQGNALEAATIEIEDFAEPNDAAEAWLDPEGTDPAVTMETGADGLFTCWLAAGLYRWRSTYEAVSSEWEPIEFQDSHAVTFGAPFQRGQLNYFQACDDSEHANLVTMNVSFVLSEADIPDGTIGLLAVEAHFLLELRENALMEIELQITDSVNAVDGLTGAQRSYAVFPEALSTDFLLGEAQSDFTDPWTTSGDMTDTALVLDPALFPDNSGKYGFPFLCSTTNPIAEPVLIRFVADAGEQENPIIRLAPEETISGLPCNTQISAWLPDAEANVDRLTLYTRYEDDTLAASTPITPEELGLSISGWSLSAILANGQSIASISVGRANIAGQASNQPEMQQKFQLAGIVPAGRRYGLAATFYYYNDTTSEEGYWPPYADFPRRTFISSVNGASAAEVPIY